mgnify:CR=1 FL=1
MAYRILKITLLLGVALLVLGLGFSLLSVIRGKCILIASVSTCRAANIGLSALLFFAVAYYSLHWIQRINSSTDPSNK